MSSERLISEPPAQYDFSDWPTFYRKALRYHESTRPDDQLVSDRIETFREFMSDRVIEYLGSLMRPHPRYQTTEGWENWATYVAQVLQDVDSSALEPSTSLNGLLMHFKAGKVSKAKFWDCLDKFVSEGELTSAEQRQLFWNAQSWEAQNELVERSPYFNPENEIWNKQEPGAVEGAEQMLAHIMRCAKLDDKIRPKQCLRKKLIFAEIALLVIALLFMVEVMREPDHKSWKYIVSVVTLSCSIELAVFNLTWILLVSVKVRKLRNKQRKLLNSVV